MVSDSDCISAGDAKNNRMLRNVRTPDILARSAGCALKRGHRVQFLLPMLQGQYRGKPVECRNPIRGDWHGCR
jgi:hypothetical protein